MAFNITQAKRKAVPVIMSISGMSGSGKTFTALLVAAGLAGPNGKVGLIDTENGRGAMYADSPGIIKALPNGYLIGQLDPPFGPERYVEALKAMEAAGVTVCVVDSTTHEWEGEGGCTDIAENNKLKGMPNWAKAKLAHKRFVNHCLSSPMHIIFCLRAREKTKIIKDANGKDQFVSQGIQPISEKNFIFEMLVSVLLEESTHFAGRLKVPEPLNGIIPGNRMLTVEDGARIREWNEGGAKLGQFEQLEKRAATSAERGTAAYLEFFTALSPADKKHLNDSGKHAANKAAAIAADELTKAAEAEESGNPVDQQKDLQQRKRAAAPEFKELPDAFSYNVGDVVCLVKDGAKTYWTPNDERSAWKRSESPESQAA